MKRFWLPLAMLVALTTLLAGSASAVQLKYTGQAYNPSFGSYYVGAYGAKINPTGDSWATNSTNWNSQPTVAAICNDYSGRINNGDVWNVAVHELTATDLADAKFWGDTVTDTIDRGNSTIDVVDYRAAAWLADQLLTYHNNWSPTTANLERTYIQYAIWSIFDMTALNSRTSTQLTAINTYRQAAFGAVLDNGYTGDAWRVYTEIPATGPKQEMLIRVPEAASLASLGLNFGALALLGFVFRRRMK